MSGGPNWPRAPRPASAPALAPRAPQTAAGRAADLEAQAAALGREMVADLILNLDRMAADAAEIAALNMMSPDVRGMASKVAEEATARAGSLRQLANIPPAPSAA